MNTTLQELKTIENKDSIDDLTDSEMKCLNQIISNEKHVGNYNEALIFLHIDLLIKKLKGDELFFDQEYSVIKRNRKEKDEDIFCAMYIYTQYALLERNLKDLCKRYNIRRNRLYKALNSKKSKVYKDLELKQPEILRYFKQFDIVDEYEVKLYKMVMKKIVFSLKILLKISYSQLAARLNNFDVNLSIKGDTLEKIDKRFKQDINKQAIQEEQEQLQQVKTEINDDFFF